MRVSNDVTARMGSLAVWDESEVTETPAPGDPGGADGASPNHGSGDGRHGPGRRTRMSTFFTPGGTFVSDLAWDELTVREVLGPDSAQP